MSDGCRISDKSLTLSVLCDNAKTYDLNIANSSVQETEANIGSLASSDSHENVSVASVNLEKGKIKCETEENNFTSNDQNESYFEKCRKMFDYGEGRQNLLPMNSVRHRENTNSRIVVNQRKSQQFSDQNNVGDNSNSERNSINVVSIELEPSKTTITSRLLVASSHISCKDTSEDALATSNCPYPNRLISSDPNSTESANFSSQMPASSVLFPPSSNNINNNKSKRSGITTVSIKAECHDEEQSPFRFRQPVDSNLSSPSKVRQCLRLSSSENESNKPPIVPRFSKPFGKREQRPLPNGGSNRIFNGNVSTNGNNVVSDCEFHSIVSNASACRPSLIFSSNCPLKQKPTELTNHNQESGVQIDGTIKFNNTLDQSPEQNVSVNQNFDGSPINESSELDISQNSEGLYSSGYSTMEDSRCQNGVTITNDVEYELESTSFCGDNFHRSGKNQKFENYRSPRGRRLRRGIPASKPVNVSYPSKDEGFVNLGEICVKKFQATATTQTEQEESILALSATSNLCTENDANGKSACLSEPQQYIFHGLGGSSSSFSSPSSGNQKRLPDASPAARTGHLHCRSMLPSVIEEPTVSPSIAGNTFYNENRFECSHHLRQSTHSKEQFSKCCGIGARPKESRSLHFEPSTTICSNSSGLGVVGNASSSSNELVKISALGHLHEESPGCCILSACSSTTSMYPAVIDGPNCCSWNNKKIKYSGGERTTITNENVTRLGIIARPCACSDIISRSSTPPLLMAVAAGTVYAFFADVMVSLLHVWIEFNAIYIYYYI